jgi:hypothetical protein
MAFSYCGFVAGAGAVEGFVCGVAFIFGPGRADSVVVGAFSVVLAPGTIARSLAKSSQAPMAMSAAMISSGSAFQSPSSVRVARSQAVLLRGTSSRSVSGSSLVGKNAQSESSPPMRESFSWSEAGTSVECISLFMPRKLMLHQKVPTSPFKCCVNATVLCRW